MKAKRLPEGGTKRKRASAHAGRSSKRMKRSNNGQESDGDVEL